jgi:hypothetical protein
MAEVELGKGEHNTPEFLAKDPFGQVLVLVDDGLVLAAEVLSRRSGLGLLKNPDDLSSLNLLRFMVSPP